MSYKYTAIIIEPRKHKALHFVLNNILDCLSQEWKIIFFHGSKNIEYSIIIVNELNKLYNDRVTLVNLNIDNLNQLSYSKLLATRTIIYDYIGTEYFLVFQTDSMMFKSNCHLINLYLNKGYDYVGAPWLICNYYPTKERDFIGNGGFSLRKTETMLKIIDNHKWNENIEPWHEDLFFTKKYDDIQPIKPSYEDAKLFCVDEVISPITMACHNFWRTPSRKVLCELYPECEILINLQDVEE
jgi:hypothetical protein